MRKARFTLENVVIDPERHLLIKEDSSEIKLPPKIISVLQLLADNHPSPVSRDLLIEQVWSGNEYIGTKALTNAVWQLRKILSESLIATKTNDTRLRSNLISERGTKNSTLAPYDEDENVKAGADEGVIETVHKVGYRLTIKPQYQYRKDKKEKVSRYYNRYFKYIYLAIALLFVEVCVFSYYAFKSSSAPEISDTLELSRMTFMAKMESLSFSPSGRYLSYVDENGKHGVDIFIRDVSNTQTNVIQATQNAKIEGKVVWSSDEKYLFYASKDLDSHTCTIHQLEWQVGKDTIIDRCPFHSKLWVDIADKMNILIYVGIDPMTEQAGLKAYAINLTQKPQYVRVDAYCNYGDYGCGDEQSAVLTISATASEVILSRVIEETESLE